MVYELYALVLSIRKLGIVGSVSIYCKNLANDIANTLHHIWNKFALAGAKFKVYFVIGSILILELEHSKFYVQFFFGVSMMNEGCVII